MTAMIACVYSDVWNIDARRWAAERLQVYIRFAAAYLGLESYRVLQWPPSGPPRVVDAEEVEPKGEVYVVDARLSAGEAVAMIEEGRYIVFRPEDCVLSAWRAAVATAPLLLPEARTVKLVSVDGLLIGSAQIPGGRVVEAAVVNTLPRPQRPKRAPVACPRCGSPGKVAVRVAVRHNNGRVCTLRRHPCIEVAATAAEHCLPQAPEPEQPAA